MPELSRFFGIVIRMFVEAGGRLVVSGNTNDAWVPGVDMHQEMEIMVDAGLTPMQVIQGSTKYAAEMLNKQEQLGTVEAGKLADFVVLSADILSVPEEQIKTIRPQATYVGGKKMYEATGRN